MYRDCRGEMCLGIQTALEVVTINVLECMLEKTDLIARMCTEYNVSGYESMVITSPSVFGDVSSPKEKRRRHRVRPVSKIFLNSFVIQNFDDGQNIAVRKKHSFTVFFPSNEQPYPGGYNHLDRVLIKIFRIIFRFCSHFSFSPRQ